MAEPHTTQPQSPARRHFLAASAAAGAKLAAAAALGTTILASDDAEAAKRERKPRTRRERKPRRDRGDPNCFLQGTRILTSQGEVRVEDLRIGDLVVTVSGQAMPIKWIGRQTYSKTGPAWQKSVMPIRVSRFAIDEKTPHRDLYLSPTHALFLDGYLMPVRELVNGTSIAPALPAGTEVIEYFHLVLDRHEVVLAEGAPAETQQVTSRKEYEAFRNFAEYERLYGDESGAAMASFAPNLGTGRAHLKALLALSVSPLVQVRDPLQEAYERIAARAQTVMA